MIDSSTTGPLSALPASLANIIKQVKSQRGLKPSNIRQIILDAQVKAEDLLPWADFQHPATDSYGRKMIYKAGNYEIMAMSWQPGDFSGIHDHGHTQWGAVQVFGPAEHATFRLEDEEMITLARWQMQPGDVVGVNHSLIHQMGNPTDQPFLSLHVYGSVEDQDSITGDARLFDLVNQQVQRVDGGVFYALPRTEILELEPGPMADFPTRLRYEVELVKRLQRMVESDEAFREDFQAARRQFFSAESWPSLHLFLRKHTDDKGHFHNSILWKVLFQELHAAATLQTQLQDKDQKPDPFQEYAAIYDAVIGQPCLEQFMTPYLRHFVAQLGGLQEKSILSLGCGTGLVESFMLEELGAAREKLLGIDISEGMIREARKRIPARQQDLLTMDTSAESWQLAYSGLNVFHYLPFGKMERAIQKTAALLEEGGHFLGDFITADHIRWYPNVIISEDNAVISLRNPALIEVEGAMFQESEIFNLHRRGDDLSIHYAGKHRRFLPPMHRVRGYFEKYFKEVRLFDAHSLQELSDMADTCPSTRYVVLARK